MRGCIKWGPWRKVQEVLAKWWGVGSKCERNGMRKPRKYCVAAGVVVLRGKERPDVEQEGARSGVEAEEGGTLICE